MNVQRTIRAPPTRRVSPYKAIFKAVSKAVSRYEVVKRRSAQQGNGTHNLGINKAASPQQGCHVALTLATTTALLGYPSFTYCTYCAYCA